jgi:hypothetical protein
MRRSTRFLAPTPPRAARDDAGVFDLTRDTGSSLTATEKGSLDPAARSTPFEATTGDGHLATITLRIPKLGTRKLALSGYGITAALAAPAPSQQTRMPQHVYDLA